MKNTYNTTNAAIASFLFNTERDPDDHTKPFPISEILSISFEPNEHNPTGEAAIVKYVDLNGKTCRVIVDDLEL